MRLVAHECGNAITDALPRFKSKYQHSLGVKGSRNKIRDTLRRIEWALRERSRVQALQKKIEKTTGLLGVIIGLALRYVGVMKPLLPNE